LGTYLQSIRPNFIEVSIGQPRVGPGNAGIVEAGRASDQEIYVCPQLKLQE